MNHHHKHIYVIELQWLGVHEGGRQVLPHLGFYYCTTQIQVEQQITSWSLVVYLNDPTSTQALMYFLVQDLDVALEVGEIIPLMEGARTVAYAMIDANNQDVVREKLSYWYSTCAECDGQGQLVLWMDEKYNRPLLCCDECDLIINLQDQQHLRMRQVRLSALTLFDLHYFNLERYAQHLYVK